MSLLMKEDTFPEAATKHYMAEMIRAVAGVHALGYIHRDLKPDNILLDWQGHLKLTDLGLSKKVSTGWKLSIAALAPARTIVIPSFLITTPL